MKRLFLILVFCSLSIPCWSQKDLNLLLEKLNDEFTPEQIDLRNEIAYQIRRKNSDSALLLIKSSLELSKQLNLPEKYVSGLIVQAEVYKIQNQTDKAVTSIKQAEAQSADVENDSILGQLFKTYGNIRKSQGDNIGAFEYYGKAIQSFEKGNFNLLVGYTYNNLGSLFFHISDYNKALDYYLKSLKIKKAYGDSLEIAPTLGNISLVYKNLEQYERSISYSKQALELSLAYENHYGSGINYANLANTFRKLKAYDSAVYYIKKSNKYSELVNNQRGLAINKINLASVFYSMGDYKNAIVGYENALNDSIILNQPYFKQEVCANLGIVYTEIEEFEKAEPYLQLALSLKDKTQDLENEVEIHHALYELKKKSGRSTEALGWLEDYTVLRDSLSNKQKAQAIANLEKDFELESKQVEINLLNEQNQKAQRWAAIQRNWMLFGIVTALSICILLYSLYRNRQKVARRLTQLDKLKSDLFANISHEFRTPLTLIKNPLEDIAQNENLSPTNREQLNTANRSTDRLLNLVDQLLDLSKLESGHIGLRVKQSDLGLFLRQLVSSFAFKAEEKQLSYRYSIPDLPFAWYDADVMQKIIENLVSNAIKYTPKGGNINLKCELVGEHHFMFSIQNDCEPKNGMQLSKVFERFYQADQTSTGVGIGLAMVKQLVRLHKGQVLANLMEDEKIQFVVTIPVNQESYPKEAVLPSTKSKSTTYETQEKSKATLRGDRPLALLVEDDMDMRQYVTSVLSTSYEVISAKNGQEGLIKAKKTIPDIVVSDVMMPDMSGIELCQQLKTEELTSHIPIILLTAKAGEENELTGLKVGADAYLLKPFKKEKLLLRTKQLISSRRNLRKRYSQEMVLQPKDIAITSADEKFLKRLQAVIDEHLQDPSFSASVFAQKMGISRMQLHRKLIALTNLSTTEFMRSQRLKAANHIINNSDLTIAEIAYQVGFNTPSYFIKCYKETYGKTPKEVKSTT